MENALLQIVCAIYLFLILIGQKGNFQFPKTAQLNVVQ